MPHHCHSVPGSRILAQRFDFGSEEAVYKSALGKAKSFELQAPFRWSVAQPFHADASWQPPVNSSFDETGCEESERDGHIDVALTAFLTNGDLFDIGNFARHDLVEPASPSRNRSDETGASLDLGRPDLISGDAMWDQDLSGFSRWRLLPGDRERTTVCATSILSVRCLWRQFRWPCLRIQKFRSWRTSSVVDIRPLLHVSQTSTALAMAVYGARAIVADSTQALRTADSIPQERRAAARC
jgi:hypothetical protein